MYWLQLWYLRRSCFLKANTSSRDQSANQSTSAIEKILANHLTSMALIGVVTQNSPTWAQYSMQSIDLMGNLYSVVNPINCLLPPLAQIYYLKVVYLSFFPFALLLAYLPVWILLRRRFKWSLTRFAATVLIIIIVLQPSVLRSLYGSFA